MKSKKAFMQKFLFMFLTAVALTISKYNGYDIFIYIVGIIAGVVLVTYSE